MRFHLVSNVYAQSLDVAVSNALYTTYVEVSDVQGTYVSRTTTSLSPFSDEIALPSTFEPFPTNQAIASAGPFEVSDRTVGFANASATSQLWFSPVVDLVETVDVEVVCDIWSGVEFSLLDLTTNSNLWSCSHSDYSGGPTNSTPWPFAGGGGIFSFSTSFSASDEYELTLMTISAAGGDSEYPYVQVTGLQAVPEPSTLVLVGCSLLAALVHRRRKG
jgi:hypothetical protein